MSKDDCTRHESWTDTQLADYECALETIGNVIALKARDIAIEKQKPVPDSERIGTLLRQQGELVLERNKLRIGDRAAISHATEQYGELVRADGQHTPD